MGRKRIKPGQLRRVGGLVMISAAVGMLLPWIFGAFSVFIAVILLVCGFYLLFM